MRLHASDRRLSCWPMASFTAGGMSPDHAPPACAISWAIWVTKSGLPSVRLYTASTTLAEAAIPEACCRSCATCGRLKPVRATR